MVMCVCECVRLCESPRWASSDRLRHTRKTYHRLQEQGQGQGQVAGLAGALGTPVGLGAGDEVTVGAVGR